MPIDYSKPSVIQFFKESYEREKDQRVGWFLTNKEKLVAHATLSDKNKENRDDDIRRTPLEMCMPILTAHHKVSAVNRRKKVSIDGPVLGIAKDKNIIAEKSDSNQLRLAPDPLMKPVEPNIRSILYEEMPKGGRLQYLKARERKIPDEKYFFCETSANVIGWQWKDSASNLQSPKYGRFQTMLHEAPRSGPQPDPKHYKLLIDQGNTKCKK